MENIEKNKLSFYGLFIMVYEQFYDEFYNRIHNFFCTNSITIIGNKILFPKFTRRDKIVKTNDLNLNASIEKFQEIINSEKDQVLALYKWMSKYNLIDKKDVEILMDIKTRRNDIAHELFNIINKNISIDNDLELFKELIKIRNKAFQNCIYYFEIIDEDDFTFIPTIKVNGTIKDENNEKINNIIDKVLKV